MRGGGEGALGQVGQTACPRAFILGHMTTRAWYRRQAVKIKQQRRLSNLVQVEPCEPPAFANNITLKGTAAKGKSYERRVNAALTRMVEDGALAGELWLGPWFRYHDDNGPGMAQPDALIKQAGGIIIVETKLKQTAAAFPQIELYGALAEALFGLPWRGVAVFKFPTLKRDSGWLDALDVVSSLAERTTYHWHFLG